MSLKQRVYYLIEPGDDSGRFIDAFILVLIFLNIVALMLETVESIYQATPKAFEVFEISSLVVFTVEYLLRLWTCTVLPRYTHPVTGRLRFFFTPLALIDMLAVLPFFLGILGIDLRYVRAVRLLRFARIFKLTRYSRSLRLLGRVFIASRAELASTFFILMVLLLLASSSIYLAEREAQPEVFSSIPAAMWWGIVTLTTVGYGDAFPITGVGQLVAAVIAILGIGMFALPTGILGANFVEQLQKERQEKEENERRKNDKADSNSHRCCPHCGEMLDKH
jgi:voltage-gated potassium channel